MRPRVRQGAGVVGALMLLASPPARAAPADPGGGGERATPSAQGPPVVAPVPRETPVEYPDGGEGEAQVVLDITIGADGMVTAAAVLSGEAPFAEAAVRAVRAWRFEPALRDGRPVPARIRYTLRFEPSREEPPTPAPSTAAPSGAAPSRGESQAVTAEPVEVIVRGAPRAPGS